MPLYAAVRASNFLHRARVIPFQHSLFLNHHDEVFSYANTLYRDEAAHIAAAATLAAVEYDGTVAGTIAAALLAPGSNHCWDAIRRRDLVSDRGGGWCESSLF